VSLLYASGKNVNLLRRLAASQIAMTDENTNYPKAGLSDQIPGLEARFNTAGADRQVTIDGDLLQTLGQMEGAGTLPPGWTNRSTGTGTAVRSTANAHGGSAHIRLAAGASGVAAASIDFLARAGETITPFQFWVDSNGAAFAELRLQNLSTLNYANASSAWQSGATYAIRSNSAAYANAAATPYQIAVESPLLCQADLVTIRLTIQSTVDVNIDVDDVAIGIALNGLLAFGHNIPIGIAVQWRHSTDNFSSSDDLVVAGAPYRPSFGLLSTATPSTRQYQRFKIPGTPPDGIPSLIGELVPVQLKTAARSVNLEPETEIVYRQVRNEVGGHVRIHAQAEHPTRIFRASKRMVSAEEWQEIRDDLLRAKGGAHPTIWIPDTNAPAPMPVAFCVQPASLGTRQPLPTAIGVWDVDDLVLVEQPFPRGAL
jgi:hypothetical protein